VIFDGNSGSVHGTVVLWMDLLKVAWMSHFTNSHNWVRFALFGSDVEESWREFWKWVMCNKYTAVVSGEYRTIRNYIIYQNHKAVHLLVLIKYVIKYTMYGMNNIYIYIYIYIYKVTLAVFLFAACYCIIDDNVYWVHRRQNNTVIATK
jgi:hypothetical protein